MSAPLHDRSRAITNLIGNAVATVVIAKSERAFTPTGVARIDSGFDRVPVLPSEALE
jgi:Na+/H+-dicarboxylate symporter